MLQPTGSNGEIFVVDDDPAIRDLLTTLFSRRSYRVLCFADAESLLTAVKTHSPACIILDVYIPGKSGLDILKELNTRQHRAPVIVISGKGDIPTAVDAIKHGALDFIEKPFRGGEVLNRVEEAIAAERQRDAEKAGVERTRFYFPGREPLTDREQDVLAKLLTGVSNKETGRQLGISHRTVEIHRARIMDKLGARNATDMVRIALSDNRG